jgi:serine/threonine-protein kinase
MLTGHPPFSGRSPQAVFLAHAEQVPEPIGNKRPDVPEPIGRVVMKCLEKLPKDRPNSAGEIVRSLRGTPAAGLRAFAEPTRLSRIPLWIPWAIAAVATVAAIAIALFR